MYEAIISWLFDSKTLTKLAFSYFLGEVIIRASFKICVFFS